MPLQYLQDEVGKTTAVLVPIEEWEAIKERHNNLAVIEKPANNNRKKASDFKGLLSAETTEALQKHVQDSREKWD